MGYTIIVCYHFSPTEEKVIYFLLLLRKEHRPSLEDVQKAPALGNELIGTCILCTCELKIDEMVCVESLMKLA